MTATMTGAAQTPALRVLYESAGLTFAGNSSIDEWALLTFASTQ